MTCPGLRARTLFACLLVLSCPGGLLADGVRKISYFRERVEMKVSRSPGGGYDIRVCGDYYFRNLTNDVVKRVLTYPFPAYHGVGPPLDIQVTGFAGLLGGSPVPVRKLERGIAFSVQIEPLSTTIIRIEYLQHTTIPKAVYITRTTAGWRIPLELAEFIVHLPRDVVLNEINYPIDRVVEREGDRMYHIRMVDFMPDEDLAFSWSLVGGTYNR